MSIPLHSLPLIRYLHAAFKLLRELPTFTQSIERHYWVQVPSLRLSSNMLRIRATLTITAAACSFQAVLQYLLSISPIRSKSFYYCIWSYMAHIADYWYAAPSSDRHRLICPPSETSSNEDLWSYQQLCTMTSTDLPVSFFKHKKTFTSDSRRNNGYISTAFFFILRTRLFLENSSLKSFSTRQSMIYFYQPCAIRAV